VLRLENLPSYAKIQLSSNQIALLDDGTPAPETGIGMLWQFYQEHPDFGFHVILFANLGDKLYANPDKPNWQDKLARAIVWCIDHDALVYNHTYSHVRLDMSNANDIKNELLQNDNYLRELLLRAGRPDLIPSLSNYFALPYSIWPTTKAGVDAIKKYTNPEGKPMLGIFEAGFDTTKLLPPPYSANFDHWHIPRFAATLSSIRTLVQQSNQMPTTTTCDLDSGNGDSAFIGDQIYLAIQNNNCPVGIYVTDQFIFDATQPADVKLIFTRTDYVAP
ncbi:MAG: hypothetical protein QMD04_11155, partial [Anaerolineales bacterium]|nr:hypothetical protein [Anaerolineales bacterium]